MKRFVTEMCSAAFAALALYASAGENLALGKTYRFSKPANYRYCADPDDSKQLTDGVYAPKAGQLWVKRECVGWSVGKGESVLLVTVDLGESKCLGGFSWHYAAGAAGVGWPSVIYVYASEDGKTWDCVGDLLESSAKRDGGPQIDRYRDYRAWSEEMPARGRYVTFAVRAENYIFCDELEVFAGDPARSQAAHGAAQRVASPAHHIFGFQLRDRVMRDLKALGGTDDPALASAVEALARGEVCDMKTVLPMQGVQARVWALNARRLAAAGFTAPAFWRNNRWENLDPLAVPTADAAAVRPIEVALMRGEVRAETVNLVNPTPTSLVCTVTLEGLPPEAHAVCREVAFTDTRDRVPISAALLPAAGKTLTLALPAGASRQVWISLEKPTLPAGSYAGAVRAAFATGRALTCPIRLRVADLDFPARTRLRVYGWDYTLSRRDWPTEAARASHVSLMRDIGMNVPWEQFSVLPQNARFAPDGALLNARELDFSRFDRWLAYFPDASRYALFLANENRKNKADEFVFLGERVEAPRFARMIGDYFRAVADRMVASGRGEERLMICFVDEPGEWKADWTRLGDLVNRLSTAVRATCPKVVFFQDPTYRDVSVAPKAYWETSDVYCPPAKTLLEKPDQAAFYRRLREGGKTLFLYSCDGPSRALDPVAYYRGISYAAFRNAAKGIGFWVFGHAPGAGCDSWHAYAQTGAEYSPYFVTPEGAVATKQSEGIREGVEDYEYLSMLAERIRAEEAAGRDASSRRELVTTGVSRVLSVCGQRLWSASNDRSAMDDFRLRVLNELERP